ncbi:MAG: CDP-archaeol synthase [Parcubacteria group bacterium]|nr:CDP-archaeol synthase [Parcubacteria group bacterium]
MLILSALYFALPIYLANMAPVLFSRVPWLAQPIDGGRLYRGQPLLGAHKTWRGLLCGVLIAILAVLGQSLATQRFGFTALNLVDYTSLSAPLLGVLMGLGAIGGDAIKSFFKRRLARPSGSSWFPFDQLDFIAGGLLLSCWYAWPGWVAAGIIVLVTLILHPLTNLAAYLLRLKNVPW